MLSGFGLGVFRILFLVAAFVSLNGISDSYGPQCAKHLWTFLICSCKIKFSNTISACLCRSVWLYIMFSSDFGIGM